MAGLLQVKLVVSIENRALNAAPVCPPSTPQNSVTGQPSRQVLKTLGGGFLCPDEIWLMTGEGPSQAIRTVSPGEEGPGRGHEVYGSDAKLHVRDIIGRVGDWSQLETTIEDPFV